MRALSTLLGVLLWASLASGQGQDQREGKQAEATAPASAPAEGDARRAALSQVLNTEDYGSAFFVGAQAELITTVAGVSSLIVGYDAVWAQLDLSVGSTIGDNPDQGPLSSDALIAALRFAVPVHRGSRSDFALFAGGGVGVVDPSEQDTFVRGIAGIGGRFRAFLTPNIAMAGTLAVAVVFGDNRPLLAMGARPLGAASVAYYFR